MSSNLWNSWDIKPPPTCRTKVILKSKEVKNLKKVVFEMLKSLRDLKQLDFEAALLSKMLYKNKRSYRNDKSIQNLVKIYQCLKRYLKLNMLETVENFNKTLPGVLPPEATFTYLPTKQMLQWILFRLQAFAKLFGRIIELTETAGLYLYGKLNLGWAVGPTICFYALNSRLMVFSKFLVLKSIEWYDSLYKFLPLLESTSEFLDGYRFPSDLKKWLGDVNISPLRRKSTIDDIFEIIDLAEAECDEDNDDIAIVKEKILKPFRKMRAKTIETLETQQTASEVQCETPKSQISASEDVGVPVEKKENNFQRGKKWKGEWRRNPYARSSRKY